MKIDTLDVQAAEFDLGSRERAHLVASGYLSVARHLEACGHGRSPAPPPWPADAPLPEQLKDLSRAVGAQIMSRVGLAGVSPRLVETLKGMDEQRALGAVAECAQVVSRVPETQREFAFADVIMRHNGGVLAATRRLLWSSPGVVVTGEV